MAVFANSAALLPDYPNEPEIKNIIENLPEGTDSFIIAESDDGTKFIQCRRMNGRYILQYNYWEKLYQCQNNELTAHQLTEIFHEFDANTENWQKNLIWKPVELYTNKVTPYSFPHILAWLSLTKTLKIIAFGLLVFLIGYFLENLKRIIH